MMFKLQNKMSFITKFIVVKKCLFGYSLQYKGRLKNEEV